MLFKIFCLFCIGLVFFVVIILVFILLVYVNFLSNPGFVNFIGDLVSLGFVVGVFLGW